MNCNNQWEGIKNKYLAKVIKEYEKCKNNPYHYLNIVQEFANEIAEYKDDKALFSKDFLEFLMSTKEILNVVFDANEIEYLDVFTNHLENTNRTLIELTDARQKSANTYKNRAYRIINELAFVYNLINDPIPLDLFHQIYQLSASVIDATAL